VARIKPAAEPVEHLPVFFVLGIFNSLQEFVVAPDAAAVFRRTGVLPIQVKLDRYNPNEILLPTQMRDAGLFHATKPIFFFERRASGCLKGA